MLNISVYDWEENKELFKVKLKEYIERIRGQSIKDLEQKDGSDIFSRKES